MLLHFHYFISLETATTQKIKVLLLWISSGNGNASGVVICWYPQIFEKGPLKKLHFLFLPRQLLCKRCSDMLSVNISSYYCNSCNQNPWKISFKKFSFRNEFLETFCEYINPGFKPQILEHLFWRTVPLAVSDLCSILVDNTSYILLDIDCIVLFRRI